MSTHSTIGALGTALVDATSAAARLVDAGVHGDEWGGAARGAKISKKQMDAGRG